MSTASLKVAPLVLMEMERRTEAPQLNHRRNGGRYRIRTYDFHRVKMALYR